MARKIPKTRLRRLIRAAWATAAFFSIGYFPTMLLAWAKLVGPPVVSMAVATVLTVPFGISAGNLRRGLLRGAWLGLAAGVGVWAGLNYGPQQRGTSGTLVFLFATAAMCAAVGAWFGWRAHCHTEAVDRAWDEVEE